MHDRVGVGDRRATQGFPGLEGRDDDSVAAARSDVSWDPPVNALSPALAAGLVAILLSLGPVLLPAAPFGPGPMSPPSPPPSNLPVQPGSASSIRLAVSAPMLPKSLDLLNTDVGLPRGKTSQLRLGPWWTTQRTITQSITQSVENPAFSRSTRQFHYTLRGGEGRRM